MTNSLIYNAVCQHKKLTEIYMGYISYPWQYAIVDYMADRTEAMPLTLFDKVISGVLQVDETLSMDRFGDILGLNIKDDPSHGIYRDKAEYDILVEALSNLQKFGMIESLNEDSYRLTNIGKEYAAQGKKFKTTQDVEFTLFFDLTSNNHAFAKKAFEDAPRLSEVSQLSPVFMDDELIKSFINSQWPGIYDTEKGNSFSNLKFLNATISHTDVNVAVLYDFQLDKCRFLPVVDGSMCEWMAHAIDANLNIYKLMMWKYMESATTNQDALKSEAQYNFENDYITAISDLEYRSYNGEDVSEEISNLAKNKNVLEQEDLMHRLLLEAKDDKKVFLFFKSFEDEQVELVTKLCSINPGISIYITVEELPNEDYNLPSNAFVVKGTIDNGIVAVTEKQISYQSFDYVFIVSGKNIIRRMLFSANDSVSTEERESVFAATILPEKFIEMEAELSEEVKANKKTIDALLQQDKQLGDLFKYIQLPVVNDLYLQLQRKRYAKIQELKSTHKATLRKNFIEYIGKNSLESLSKLQDVDRILNAVEGFEKQLYPDYNDLTSDIKNVKNALLEKKLYIKEQLAAKAYIIDTNEFLYDPNILDYFDARRDTIVVSAKVIDELDGKKRKSKDKPDLPKKAADAQRNINRERKKGKLKLKFERANVSLLPVDLDKYSPDNMILSIAIEYENKKKNPFIITTDNGLQLKAAACGIPCKSLKEFIDSKTK